MQITMIIQYYVYALQNYFPLKESLLKLNIEDFFFLDSKYFKHCHCFKFFMIFYESIPYIS